MVKKIPPDPKLQKRIAALAARARANPGKYATMRLPDDLKIDVSVHGDSIWIRMSRSTRYPTKDEWASLTRHWPEPIDPIPKRTEMFGRCYLTGIWTAALPGSPSSVKIM